MRRAIKFVVIAADEDKIKLSESNKLNVDETAIRQGVGAVPEAEQILILGCNKRVAVNFYTVIESARRRREIAYTVSRLYLSDIVTKPFGSELKVMLK